MITTGRKRFAVAIGNDLNGTAIVLLGLLIWQLLLAVALKLSETQYHPFEQKAALFKADWQTADKLTIAQGGADGKIKNEIVIEKKNNAWVLPGEYDFPVSSTAMANLFKNIKSVQKGYPVSTTSGAADRFKTGDHNFICRLQASKGGASLGTLYAGSSPSFNSLYVRTDESNNVYAVDLPAYAFNARVVNWMDTHLASVPQDTVVSADFGSYRVAKSKSDWLLSYGSKEQKISREAALLPLTQAGRMEVLDVLGVTDEPAYDSGHPLLSYSVQFNNGKTLSLVVSKPADKDYAVMKISDKPFYMKVDLGSAMAVKKLSVSDLLNADAEQQAKQARAKKLHAQLMSQLKPTLLNDSGH